MSGVDPHSPPGRAARIRRVELQAALWGPRWTDVYDDGGDHLGRVPVNVILGDGLAAAVERVEQLAAIALSTRPGGFGGGYRGGDTGESAVYQALGLRYDEQADRLAIGTVDGDPLLVVPGPTLRAGLVEPRAGR
jgi:hypothetical protein